ncbi:MAG: UMP kinase [Candidatus Pacebacteria bacterium]|nr:UMP kinase [Candidatus Paceibacterota bacterium]MBP9840745.1 UMP kinase [Candidatus Paceibacterota bacterium]
MDTPQERIIVSVGGSLIVPGGVDTGFLIRLRDLVTQKVNEGFSFYIITGGGKLSREWRDAALAINPEVSNEQMDYVGIAATRTNAELVRSIFAGYDIPSIILDVREPITSTSPIVIAGGLAPGWSTDYCAVLAAKATGAKKLVNLSNIDYVYTADPRTDSDAVKIEKTSWADFRKLIPDEWNPGLSSPFDPVAAKEAESLGLEVVVMNGSDLSRFADYLEGKPFVGTVIS